MIRTIFRPQRCCSSHNRDRSTPPQSRHHLEKVVHVAAALCSPLNRCWLKVANGTGSATSVTTAPRLSIQSSLATGPTKMCTARPATERNGDRTDTDSHADQDSYKPTACRKLPFTLSTMIALSKCRKFSRT